MNLVIKIVSIIVFVYVLIGIFQAVTWSVSYDPARESAPNNLSSFILNTLLWPM